MVTTRVKPRGPFYECKHARTHPRVFVDIRAGIPAMMVVVYCFSCQATPSFPKYWIRMRLEHSGWLPGWGRARGRVIKPQNCPLKEPSLTHVYLAHANRVMHIHFYLSDKMRSASYTYFLGALCIVLMLIYQSEAQWRPQGRFGKRDPATEGEFNSEDGKTITISESFCINFKIDVFIISL
jgi:hypothetical protein